MESRAGTAPPLGCIPPHPEPVNFGNTSLISWSPEQAASSADRLGPAADPWPPSPLQKELSKGGLHCVGWKGSQRPGPSGEARENREVGPHCWASEIS